MLKTIGSALVAVAAALSLATPARANAPSIVHAETVVGASPYVNVWHRAHHGYKLTANQQPTVRVPNRPQEVRRCEGDLTCKASIVSYYHGLHTRWLTLNRSLWVMVAAYPICGTGVVDCLPPPKTAQSPMVVEFQGVLYYPHHVPA